MTHPFRLVRSVLLVSALAACDRPTTAPAGPAAPEALASAKAEGPPAAASAPAAPSTAAPPSRDAATVTFDSEATGGPSPSFEPIVGDWYVGEQAGARGLVVDGSRWRNGTPSANLADQAKRLYGARYAEFLDGVKTFAFFPFAIWQRDPPSGDIRISLRFYPFAGKIDQAAGIAFAIAPDGTYLGVRANALEDNLLFFRVVKGKRTIIDNVRNVPTPSKTWHTLAVELRGQQLAAFVNGERRLEKTLDAAPAGKFGLWSKADSQVLFDDIQVQPLP